MSQTAFIYLKNDILNSENNKDIILCIGEVQSGKTRFIIEKAHEALINYDYDCVIVLGGINNILLKQTFNRFIKERNESNNRNIMFHSLDEFIRISNEEFPSKKFIISVLKSTDAMTKLSVNLDNFIKHKKVLIIDDESDFASVENKKTSSIIYTKIHNLYRNIKSGVLLYVTATPFSNILCKNKLTPRKIHKIKPNSEYTGIDFFMQHNECFAFEDETNADKFYNDGEYWYKKIYDHVKRVHDSGLEKSQFLINFSSIKRDHEKIKKVILDTLFSMSKRYISDIFDENKFNLARVGNILENITENIVCLNNDLNEQFGHSAWINKHSIIIGGHMISRGYTFSELISCIMLNVPKNKANADTLMQRARWFGYRKKNDMYKFMKIYIESRTFRAYNECRILNDIIMNNDDIHVVESKIKETQFLYINPTGKK